MLNAINVSLYCQEAASVETAGEVTCAETDKVTGVTVSGSQLQMLMEDSVMTYITSNMAA